ncbi:MAG: CopG family ribbon-helix-helix protein [Nitrososphaerales archaeon]
MAIISLSINDKLLEELDKIQREGGFSGRSEALRAAIRLLLSEHPRRVEPEERVVAVLMLIHGHEAEDIVTEAKHKFIDVVHTQVHNRFKAGKCLELFILNGLLRRILELKNIFQRSDKIDYIKLLII